MATTSTPKTTAKKTAPKKASSAKKKSSTVAVKANVDTKKALVKKTTTAKTAVKPVKGEKVVNKTAAKAKNTSKSTKKETAVKTTAKKTIKATTAKATAKKSPAIKPVAVVNTENKKAVDTKTTTIETPKIAQRPKIVSLTNVAKFDTNFNRADMFYKNVLKVDIVKRYSTLKKEDKEFLDKDINLTVRMNGTETTISEKLREQDWNDIYVEIFQKYPEEEGWMKVTEAEYLAYFFPGRVFWAKMEPIKMLCQNIFSKALESGIYKDLYYMFPKNSGRLSKTFKINTKTYSFNFIQTYHEDKNKPYYSIGISLPFVLLLDFRIDYKVFKQ